MASNSSGVSLERLAVKVLLKLQAEPGQWTARSLARELGETANRISRIVLAIDAEVGVERQGAYGALTVRAATAPAVPAVPTDGASSRKALE